MSATAFIFSFALFVIFAYGSMLKLRAYRAEELAVHQQRCTPFVALIARPRHAALGRRTRYWKGNV
jgi:hypothetical protein